MIDSTARRIWLICAGLTFVLSFNYFSESQQWGTSIGLGFLNFELGISNVVSACLIGLPVTAIGLIISLTIALRYVKSHNAVPGWVDRVPVKINGINSGSFESKFVAFAALFFFVLLPLYWIWHFFRKFLNYAVVCDNRTDLSKEVSLWSNPGDFRLFDNSFLVGSSEGACSGVTFEPFLQPLLMLVLACICTVLTIALIINLLVKPRDA